MLRIRVYSNRALPSFFKVSLAVSVPENRG